MIQNSQNPKADLSKKHVAIAYHVTREAVAAGIIRPHWLKGKHNTPDIMTKQLSRDEHKKHCDYIFWRPNFHVRENNRLSGKDSDL